MEKSFPTEMCALGEILVASFCSQTIRFNAIFARQAPQLTQYNYFVVHKSIITTCTYTTRRICSIHRIDACLATAFYNVVSIPSDRWKLKPVCSDKGKGNKTRARAEGKAIAVDVVLPFPSNFSRSSLPLDTRPPFRFTRYYEPR